MSTPAEDEGQKPAQDAAGGLKKKLRPALTLVSLAFVVWAAWDLAARWESTNVELDWTPALLSVLPLVLGSFVQGWCWIRLIDRMSDQRVPRAPSMALYLESQIARYMPGKVGLPLVRMAGAPRIGVAASTVGSSVLIEMLSWMAVGATLGFLLLTGTSEHVSGVAAVLGQYGPWLLGASALGVLGLLVVDRRRLPGAVQRTLKLDGRGPLVPLSVPLIHVAYWGTWAVHGYLVAAALGAGHDVAGAASGLFVLAPIAGFIVLAAPAGIGVREAVLSVGLAATVGPAPALAAAIISRAASLIADVGSWIVTRPLARDPDGPGGGTLRGAS